MTIYSKTNPIGLDLQLLRIQTRIESLGWENIDVYGKLYINEREKGIKVAEAHLNSGEYKDIFIDDNKSAVFGFIVDESRNNLSMIKCNVKLICSCRLDIIYNSNERMDEEALLTVLEKIRPHVLLPNQGGIKTGLANVFSDVSYEKFKFRDMNPYFNFSISFDLVYKSDVHKILN